MKKVFLLVLFALLFTPRVEAQSNDNARVLTLINQARITNGLTPLALNATLNAAAQAHANDLANAGVNYAALGHNGSDGSTPPVRMQRAGYPAYPNGLYVGENWAAYQTVDDAMNFWMSDVPHRANILRVNFREIGIGVAPSVQGNPIVITDFGAQPNVLPAFVNWNGSTAALTLTNELVYPAGDGANVIGQAVSVELSTRANFSPSRTQPFSNTISFVSTDAPASSKIYVKFFDAQGRTVQSSAAPLGALTAPVAGPAFAAPAAAVTPSATATIAATATKTATLFATSTRTATPRATATRTATTKPLSATRTPTRRVVAATATRKPATVAPAFTVTEAPTDAPTEEPTETPFAITSGVEALTANSNSVPSAAQGSFIILALLSLAAFIVAWRVWRH